MLRQKCRDRRDGRLGQLEAQRVKVLGIVVAVWTFDEPYPAKFFDQAGSALAECATYDTRFEPEANSVRNAATAIPTPTVGDQSFGVRLGAVQNQAGQNWVGSLNYTIPWLDLDFADFRKNRTSLSFGVGSDVGGNIALLDANKEDTGRDYTTRTNGFSLGLGRNTLTRKLGSSRWRSPKS